MANMKSFSVAYIKSHFGINDMDVKASVVVEDGRFIQADNGMYFRCVGAAKVSDEDLRTAAEAGKVKFIVAEGQDLEEACLVVDGGTAETIVTL